MWRAAKKIRITRVGLDTDRKRRKQCIPVQGNTGLRSVLVLFSKANPNCNRNHLLLKDPCDQNTRWPCAWRVGRTLSFEGTCGPRLTL